MNCTKADLIKLCGISDKVYDTALPQQWLNNFVKETGLDYHHVLCTTVWMYEDSSSYPVSCCTEIQEKINRIYY